jgi:diguanylate cyclase (GGDEF)-like protein
MAFSIRNLRIRDQIRLATLPPLFVLLCAVALFFYAYWSALNTQKSATHTNLSMARGESFLRHATEASMAVRGYVFAHQKDSLDSYDKAVVDSHGDLFVLRQLENEDPDQRQDFKKIQLDFDLLQKEWALPAIDAARKGKPADPTAVMQDGEARLSLLRSEVQSLLKEDESRSAGRTQRTESIIRRMLAVGIGLAALLAGILVLVTGIVTRMIVVPVLQLIRASEQVSRGDFAPDLPPMVDNEFGVLSRSFSNMTTALRREREEIAALNQFSEAVTQCTSEREVYDLLLHSLKERFQPRQVIIFKLNLAENFLEAAATLVPLPKEVGAWPVIEEPHHCKAVRAGRAFRVNDVTVEPLCPAHFVPPREGSYYCGPLIAGGIITGSVRMEAAKDLWSPDRERVLESYLNGAASALSNLRLLDTMKRQANIDVLTGLYNRRFLDDYARKLFAIARRRDQPVGVIMMDLDHFKSRNDVFGHEMGDRILRHFAKTVTGAMRETNLAARYGGEEFVVLLPDTNGKTCALVAERIRRAVMTMVVPSNAEKPLPQLTVSMGIAVFPDHGQTLEEVVQASDKALYESKRAGRNRVTLYTPQETAAG